MALNKSKGNMYDWVNVTWNTVKGICPHDCTYCYCKAIAKRFNAPQKSVHFDEKELKTNLGSGNFIFVGSSNDMFAKDIPDEWIIKTLAHCLRFDNKYLFQTKNPDKVKEFMTYFLPKEMLIGNSAHKMWQNSCICTTLETNRHYPDVMCNSPKPEERVAAMEELKNHITTYVTVEPIMDFDLEEFVSFLKRCNPKQVNIGADSGKNGLPEPSREKVLELIAELEKFTVVKQKSNLKRLLEWKQKTIF